MDFDDTAEEAAFRAEARAFLDAHAPDARSLTSMWPPRTVDPGRDEDLVVRSRAWQRLRYDHGFAGLTWPVEYGGRGLPALMEAVFDEEQGGVSLLSGVFQVGIGMVGPTIMEHGTHEQKQAFLDPMLRGEQVWCQLFSEPGAGSDLASLTTRAVRDGEEWVVRGQKVWTSNAHYSDWGILLARTDLDAPKHRGITCFLVDMRSPGIDIRPLRQATGSAEFNEVFLTDLRVPDAHRLGAVNDGWRVALSTLTSERASIGGNSRIVPFDEVLDLARACGRAADPVARQDLARYHTRERLLTWLGWRARTAVSHGRRPGPESSVAKLAMSNHLEAMGNTVLALQGAAGMADFDDAVDGGRWQGKFLFQWASRIGGGTDQVQRNILGERVLGLPAEPRTDKDVPFRRIPTN